MKRRLRKVSSEDELHDKVEDYQIQNYKVVEWTDNHAKLRSSSFGSGGMHVLWFFLTSWWTVGLGNVLYATYSYFSNSQEIVIKVEKDKEYV